MKLLKIITWSQQLWLHGSTGKFDEPVLQDHAFKVRRCLNKLQRLFATSLKCHLLLNSITVSITKTDVSLEKPYELKQILN